MANVASPSCSRTVLLLGLGACAALGGYVLHEVTREPAATVRAPAAPVAPAPTSAPAIPRLPAVVEPEPAAPAPAFDDDAARGHAAIDDPAEFAFVFVVDGVSYVRLGAGLEVTAGAPRLIAREYQAAVVAPVEPSALPAALRAWAGRAVLVDGACEANVVGFAEVSRITGVAGGYEDDGRWVERGWTIEDVQRSSDAVVAARLDRCTGTWARARDYPGAAVAIRVEAPALEAAARNRLLAPAADPATDATQRAWTETGGEGDWRKAVTVTSSVYRHPRTGERWVIVQAVNGGGCGEPYVDRMAVYRARGREVRQVAALDHAASELHQVVDLDGDGQPELVMGGGDAFRLVDLANTVHTSIYTPSNYEGCGC